MASSSILPAAHSRAHHAFALAPDEADLETSRLIAQIALDDIVAINGSRKGKGRADAPLSDEETAFRFQFDYWENLLRIIDNRRIAESISTAMAADRPYLNALSIIEQAARDDHQAAQALASGGELPRPSQAQRSLEDPAFYVPFEP